MVIGKDEIDHESDGQEASIIQQAQKPRMKKSEWGLIWEDFKMDFGEGTCLGNKISWGCFEMLQSRRNLFSGTMNADN